MNLQSKLSITPSERQIPGSSSKERRVAIFGMPSWEVPASRVVYSFPRGVQLSNQNRVLRPLPIRLLSNCGETELERRRRVIYGGDNLQCSRSLPFNACRTRVSGRIAQARGELPDAYLIGINETS
ncbi:hypothetical protein F2Q70_00036780 [Brassica cretica]|uniref:Uncharacterized protein n=1 Tax=Brassica cretica TaxID=69181 RepID=A0A8S9JX17_BRACR|nr:hypothetical protein F2Q70_00036780 [Brassica cretica]